jgi:adenylate kinase family enzyme
MKIEPALRQPSKAVAANFDPKHALNRRAADIMRRVLVIGSGGAGKSTVARRLGGLLGLPVVHLDQLYWKVGWIETEKTEWAEMVRQTIARDAWIVDGNYSGTLAERLEACDTVVFLDVPRVVCLWRVLLRTVRHYGRTRPDMPDGCPERLDVSFLTWIWNYPTRSRRKVLSLLSTCRDSKNVVHLRTRRDVELFLSAQRQMFR